MAREVHRLDQQPHRGAQEGRLQDLRDGRLSLQGGWGGDLMPAALSSKLMLPILSVVTDGI